MVPAVGRGGDRGEAGRLGAMPGPFDPDSATLARLREVCDALPEVEERLSHGSPSWFVRGKKTFVSFVDDHHGDGILGFWCAAPPGVQSDLVDTEPERFFVPPYVGHRGWLGVRLDVDPDWDEVAGIVTDAYCTVAPKTLARRVRPDG